MKKQKNLRSYLLGILTTLMVLALATPALASVAQKTIQVSSGVRIFIDDVELRSTDANGNPVEVFVYNGTTYLPVRAVSEGLGKPVQWDGSTRSVYIGKHSSDTPVAWLAQMDYFNATRKWSFDNALKDNLGNEHLHTLYSNTISNFGDGSNSITYKLDGQYSRFTALYYQRYEYRDKDQGSTFTLVISGDGKELWRGTVGAGIDPIDIDIDISNVLELTMEYPKGTPHPSYYTAIGDAALWS